VRSLKFTSYLSSFTIFTSFDRDEINQLASKISEKLLESFQKDAWSSLGTTSVAFKMRAATTASII